MPDGDWRFYLSPLIGCDGMHDMELACALILDQADKMDELKKATPGSPLSRAVEVMRSIVSAIQDAEVEGPEGERPVDLSAGGPFKHGDLVRLQSDEVVRWQDGEHPPVDRDRGWHCHPQNATGGDDGASWDNADLSLNRVDEMWEADSLVRPSDWKGGLVAPTGRPIK